MGRCYVVVLAVVALFLPMTELAAVGALLLLLRISGFVATEPGPFPFSFVGIAQIVTFVEGLFDRVDNHVFPLGFVVDSKYLRLGVGPHWSVLVF